ncbi:hypothetical protein [Phenylobacterium sp.]|uniref:DUF4139 domain-containing protein n=1 Tax=Phenylobacterium sp. TaxID=1871053 RepID=UPI002E369790|nr:hypothetical protein [Phenylobacterium sp.]HEX2561458.1 hypothetical protein [Phenylobacterium sp.]
MMRGSLAALAILAAWPVAAEVVSEAPEAVSVTVYREGGAAAEDLWDGGPGEGLVLISETRTIELPAGESRLKFRGVADTMVARTAALDGLPAEVLERNQDYDLLSPGSLLDRSIGRTVRLVRTNPASGLQTEERAVVRSDVRGVVLDFGDGRIEALRCSGLPERLVFDELPPELADKPTFSVLARAPAAGRYKVRLSYLATGVSWAADYVAQIAPDGRTLDLSGWITLSNRTSATLRDAPTQVVAGNLSRDEDTVPVEVEAQGVTTDCWLPDAPVGIQQIPLPAPMASMRVEVEEVVVTGSFIARQSELGDYKLYTLPVPTTLAANQVKQIRFLDQTGVRFDRLYRFELDPEPDGDEPLHPSVLLRMKNLSADGLGVPLPQGNAAVMERVGGRMVFAGEDQVRDTAVGLPFEITFGQAQDVGLMPRVTKREDILKGGEEVGERLWIEAEVWNDKPVAVTVELNGPPTDAQTSVGSASRRYKLVGGRPVWTLSLAPGQRARLSWIVEIRNL